MRQGLDMGLIPEDIAYYRYFAEKVVDKDMALRKRMMKDKSFEDTIEITLEMTKFSQSLRAYIFDKVFRQRALSQDLYLYSEPKNK